MYESRGKVTVSIDYKISVIIYDVYIIHLEFSKDMEVYCQL